MFGMERSECDVIDAAFDGQGNIILTVEGDKVPDAEEIAARFVESRVLGSVCATFDGLYPIEFKNGERRYTRLLR